MTWTELLVDMVIVVGVFALGVYVGCSPLLPLEW